MPPSSWRTAAACLSAPRPCHRPLFILPLLAARHLSSTSAASSASPAALPGRVGVVGGGQMGTGIAYVASVVAGLPALIVDSRQSQLDSSRAMIRSLLDKEERKGRMTQQARQEAERRIAFTSDIAQLVSERVPFIIEAVTENLDVKRNILTALKGLQTADSTLKSTLHLAASMGKTVTQSKDVPGFVANRLLMPYINEAVAALSEGTASRDDIDTCMRLGCNMPMGPLQLADFIGLDTCLYIMRTLHSELGDSKYRPAVLLQSYVDAGWLGRKSGRGFYEYGAKR